MDELINPSVENIFLQNLKLRIEQTVGEKVEEDVTKWLNENSAFNESCINDIASKYSMNSSVLTVKNDFFHELNNLLHKEQIDISELYLSSINELRRDSVMGSLSSLNSTSIDFLSSDQLHDIADALVSPSITHKLESLGTLCRLSSLEHIAKQTLWPNIEKGLHELMCSDVNFLKDGALSVFIKMLSSPEPQVVREGFVSLIKIVPKILTSVCEIFIADPNHPSNIYIKRIIQVINKFQQCIPAHWLRYPRTVMKDIIYFSVSLLQNTTIWNIFMSLDMCSMWLHSFMYGSISRSLLLNAFDENLLVLEYVYRKCMLLNLPLNYDCCTDIKIIEKVHAVCFLSYFLQYKQGRKLLDKICKEENAWIVILYKIFEISKQLCNYSCFKCVSYVQESLKCVCYKLSYCKEANIIIDELLNTFLTENFEEVNLFHSYLLSGCLTEIIRAEKGTKCISLFKICETKTHSSILSHFIFVLKSLNDPCGQLFPILKSSLILLQVFIPLSYDFENIIVTSNSLQELWNIILKSKISLVAHLAKQDQVIYESLKINIVIEALKRPTTFLACHNSGYYNECMFILYENIKLSMENKVHVCFCDIFTLSHILSYNCNRDLNKSIVRDVILYLFTCHDRNYEPTAIYNAMTSLISSTFNSFYQQNQHSIFVEDDLRALSEIVLYVPSEMLDTIVCNEDVNVLCLTILSVLIYDFHTTCILHTKFNIQEYLINLLHDFMEECHSTIINPVTILLNYIIIKLYSPFISPATLPIRDVTKIEDIYTTPFVHSYPPHFVFNNCEDYTLDLMWLNQVTTIVDRGIEINSKSIPDLLMNFNQFVIDDNLKSISSEQDVILNENIKTAICLTARFSSFICEFTADTESNLKKLIEKCCSSLIAPHVQCLDIFVGTVFLLFECNLDDSWKFLKKYAQSWKCVFIWDERVKHLSECSEHCSFTQSIIMEFCNRIAEDCLPCVYQAFKKFNTLPSVLYYYWIKQCFWNYLDWIEIQNFVILCIICGEEYSVYYFVAILKHLERFVRKYSYIGNVVTYLKENPITGFDIKSNIDYIVSLAEMYKDLKETVIKKLIL